MNALINSIVQHFRHRKSPSLQIVGARMLANGAAVYAVDIDGRRIVFATAPSAVTLLAQYPVQAARGSEGSVGGTGIGERLTPKIWD